MQGITCDAESVLAILAGRKGRTTRVAGCLKPTYRVGRTYYVREQWRVRDCYRISNGGTSSARVQYAANNLTVMVPVTAEQVGQAENYTRADGKWANPRFMPEWAARIEVTVTAVEVWRPQEFDTPMIIAEGCPTSRDDPAWVAQGDEPKWWEARWRGIHADDPVTGWDADPVCWSYTFDWKLKGVDHE